MTSMPRWTGLVLDVLLLMFSWLLLDVPQCNGDPLCFFKFAVDGNYFQGLDFFFVLKGLAP
jgi:hypothetical protein